MNIKLHFLVLLSCLSLAAFGLSACGEDDAGDDPVNNAPNNDPNNDPGDTFEATALPILEASGCNDDNCHGGDGFLGGGLSLESFDSLKAGRDGTFTPCDAENSTFITKLSDPPPFGSQMPLGRDPLSAGDIETLTNWVNAGSDVQPLCN